MKLVRMMPEIEMEIGPAIIGRFRPFCASRDNNKTMRGQKRWHSTLPASKEVAQHSTSFKRSGIALYQLQKRWHSTLPALKEVAQHSTSFKRSGIALYYISSCATSFKRGAGALDLNQNWKYQKCDVKPKICFAASEKQFQPNVFYDNQVSMIPHWKKH